MVLYWKIFGSERDDPSVSKAVKEATVIPHVQPDEVEELKRKIKYPEFLAAVSPDEIGKYSNEGNRDHAKDDKGHLGTSDFANFIQWPEHHKIWLVSEFGPGDRRTPA